MAKFSPSAPARATHPGQTAHSIRMSTIPSRGLRPVDSGRFRIFCQSDRTRVRHQSPLTPKGGNQDAICPRNREHEETSPTLATNRTGYRDARKTWRSCGCHRVVEIRETRRLTLRLELHIASIPTKRCGYVVTNPKDAISTAHGVPDDMIVLGNGGDALIKKHHACVLRKAV